MTVKKAILGLSKKWRTYDEIGADVKSNGEKYSYETISSAVRSLRENKQLIRKEVKVIFEGKVKKFVKFKEE